MQLTRIRNLWKKERLGLLMILASLGVILLIVGLLFANEQRSEEEHIRKQGASLVRVLSRMPLAEIAPQNGKQGILSVLEQIKDRSAFSYLAIVDANNRLLSEITMSDVLVPSAPLPADPASWLGERVLQQDGSGREITEFHAPLLDDGVLAGHIRLGYLKSGIGIEQLPFLATLALPIFMLTPLFYFLIRREVRPLQKVNSRLDQLVEQGSLNKVEIAATGELKDFMGRFNGFIESARDRINQLESEKSSLETSSKLLSYNRSRIESVLQSLPDAVMVMDESGTVSLANARFKSLLGVPPLESIIGKKPLEWSEDKDLVAFLAGCSGRSTRGFRIDRFEYSPALSPDKTIAVMPLPLFSPKDDSQILGTLVVFRDITAETLAKLSSGAFVAHVAHELKSPLNIIAMYSETMLGEEGGSEEFRIEAGNIIHDETERLAGLIDNILSITKIEMGGIALDRQRVKIGEMLRDSFDACTRDMRGKELDLQIELPKEMSAVAIDKNLFRIAVNNLLTNAIKYSNPGGQVTLSAEEDEESTRITVRDNGIGISPEEHEKIFDKFYRSESAEAQDRNGHGLGLALAREIVQLHHGTLSLESTPGEGSEFVIEFRKETGLLKQVV
jgi:signal transduction histidine kinase